MGIANSIKVQRIDDYRWRLPREGQMRVDGLVFASEAMMQTLREDQSVEQVANVATLPGIVGHSIAMPDIHWGYGFPIGGVAATRVDDGVVSPGGVGFDINCGVRLLRTPLMEAEVRPKLKPLLDQIFRDVPAGTGRGADVGMSKQDLNGILVQGAAWAVELGYGTGADLDTIESNGRLEMADPDQVSDHARKRGAGQLGTLGSGNHFLEIQALQEILDPETARVFGIEAPGQIFVFIHTGSRGLGHQVCQDFLGRMQAAMKRYDLFVADRQLACAPVRSEEGAAYLGAMAAAANF